MKKFYIILILFLIPFCLFSEGEKETQQVINSILPGLVSSETGNTDEISIDLAKLERLYRFVDKYYLYDIDKEKVYEAMASALFESLDDPYTYYVAKEAKDDYVEAALGTYAGLGIQFTKTRLEYKDPDDIKTNYCLIDTIFPGTPSEKAGLRTGDYITEIEGEAVDDMEATACAQKMKGESGTEVTITVLRGEKTFNMTLEREIVKVPTVKFTVIDNKYGYIQIAEFTDTTTEKVKDAIDNFNKNNIDKIIIDLRNNGGGDISVALQIADFFIDSKKLLTINYKEGTEEDNIFYATAQTLVPKDTNCVVLVNSSSASSSEILTGALKDDDRAIIIGEKTFGKGCMQIVTPFAEGYISLTRARFLPPSMEPIHDVGIEPDIEELSLEMTDEEFEIYQKLFDEKLFSKYVDANPDFTKENIEAFKIPEEEGTVRDQVLKVLIRNEYLSRLPSEERLIPDPEYDKVLKRAITYFETGK